MAFLTSPSHKYRYRCQTVSSQKCHLGWRLQPGLCTWHHQLLLPLLAITTQDQLSGTKDNQPMYLSDIIAFQSSTEELSDDEVEVASAKADEIINRATQVLKAARATLASQSSLPRTDTKKMLRSSAASKPSANRFTPESVYRDTKKAPSGKDKQAPATANGAPTAGLMHSAEPGEQLPSSSSTASADERKRRILQNALADVKVSSLWGQEGTADTCAPRNGPSSAPGSGEPMKTSSWTPDWAQGLVSDTTFGPMVLQPLLNTPHKGTDQAQLAYADPEALPSMLTLRSQAQEDADRARNTELPPLQSVLELTSAFRPPMRSGMVDTATATEEGYITATSQQAKELVDGKAVLADGTRFEKLSGEEKGENGYWCKWHLIRGLTADSTVAWEEKWYEKSDWFGLKEMGAEKKGSAEDGSSWKESWREKIYYHPSTLEPVVERAAHKWAHDAEGDEWEEKWNEYYSAKGQVTKSADKWGKQGPNVWHEAWGEDYDGAGACVKWTDKWAERVVVGGAREQWGDKWEERFGDGCGSKTGEVWNVDAAGNRYNRWWGEDHQGNGTVRRHGHSTSGEQWDFTEAGDTYYNPIPHFGFKLAYEHSPQLASIPVLPKDDPQGRYGGLGPGMDEL